MRKAITKATEYKCESSTNKYKHIFQIPDTNGQSSLLGVCKLCGYERIHNVTIPDVMASGRKASKEKLEAKKRKEKLEKHKTRRAFMNGLTSGFNTDVN